MDWTHYLTVGAMAASTALSTVLPVLPPQYAVIANGVLGVVALFLRSPVSAKK